MQIIEAASHEEEKLTLSSANEARIEGWKPSAIATDIATLGSGTMLAALVNVVPTFLIPRLISVEDYGYWRLFAPRTKEGPRNVEMAAGRNTLAWQARMQVRTSMQSLVKDYLLNGWPI